MNKYDGVKWEAKKHNKMWRMNETANHVESKITLPIWAEWDDIVDA